MNLRNRQIAICTSNFQAQILEKGIYKDNDYNQKNNRVGMYYGRKGENLSHPHLPPLEGKALTEHLKKLTTADKYIDKHTKYYNNDRFDLHRQIVNDIVSKGSVREQPTALLLLGGSGSGKSHVYKTQLEGKITEHGDSFAYLNVDDIKEQLPEFKKYIKQDPYSAACRVHEESADIGRIAYRKLIKQKRCFVLDATLCNSYSAVAKIDELKKAGYKVHLCGVVADLDVVKKAVTARAKVTGRHVPMDMVVSKQLDSRKTFNYIATKEANKLEDISLFNNSGMLDGKKPIKVFQNGVVLDHVNIKVK